MRRKLKPYQADRAGRGWRGKLVALLCGLALLPLLFIVLLNSRNGLWLVTRACALNQRAFGIAVPCLVAGPTVAVVRNPFHRNRLMVIPLIRTTGLESSALQGALGFVIFGEAWLARRFLPTPSDGYALAVNSRQHRSQDQLHIHLGCLRQRELMRMTDLPRPALGSWARAPWSSRVWYKIVPRPPDDAFINPVAELENFPVRINWYLLNLAIIAPPPTIESVFVLLVSPRDSLERITSGSCTS